MKVRVTWGGGQIHNQADGCEHRRMRIADEEDDDVIVAFISCGEAHIILVTEDNMVYSAGNNYYGQLGLGHAVNQREFQRVEIRPFGNESVKRLVCGPFVSAIITESGKLYVTGNNWRGMLGLGDELDRYSFVRLNVENNDLSKVTHFAVGSHHCVAVIDNRHIYACGWNYDGECGMGHSNNITTFQRIDHPLLNALSIRQISCGGGHTVLLTENNELYATGSNSTGRLGLGFFSTKQLTFHRCDTSKLNNQIIKQIACGCSHTCVLTFDGCLYTCGRNNTGECAYGNFTKSNILTRVDTKSKFIENLCSSSYSESTVVLTDQKDIYAAGSFCVSNTGNRDPKVLERIDPKLPITEHLVCAVNSLYLFVTLTSDTKNLIRRKLITAAENQYYTDLSIVTSGKVDSDQVFKPLNNLKRKRNDDFQRRKKVCTITGLARESIP